MFDVIQKHLSREWLSTFSLLSCLSTRITIANIVVMTFVVCDQPQLRSCLPSNFEAL